MKEELPLGVNMLGPFDSLDGSPSLRTSSKTLKCPKCNWHYKYQETMEIHMKEKHSNNEVRCVYCTEGRAHPRLSRGETYSCGYKPYRCEVCKYSTTTKGNLSIHMQSDKHLHAIQELPDSIVRSSHSPADHLFLCLLCGTFSSNNVQDMVIHVEKDRSRPHGNDVLVGNGLFRCQLCPYSTTLKANFQLHMRTDKHSQRVQMVNHLREGGEGSPSNRIAKTLFQVLCRKCEEVLSCVESLREHSEEVRHKVVGFHCTLCPYSASSVTEAIGHLPSHDASMWTQQGPSLIEDWVFRCASCPFSTQEEEVLEEHEKSHGERTRCPLCDGETARRLLADHLIQVHHTAESAVSRLLANKGSSEYPFACSACPRWFRSDSVRDAHMVGHSFACSFLCPSCSFTAASESALTVHTKAAHAECVCGECGERLSGAEALAAHRMEHEGMDLSVQCPSPLPFRCNLCILGYGNGTNLDAHLRSVSHMNRMARVAELMAAGEVDGDRPVSEQPGGLPQKAIRDLVDEDEGVNVMQMVNMAMLGFMNNLPESARDASADAQDDDKPPHNQEELLIMLDKLGDTEMRTAVAELTLDSVDEGQWEEMSRCECSPCAASFPTLLILKKHCHDIHDGVFPSQQCAEFLDRLRKVSKKEKEEEKEKKEEEDGDGDGDGMPPEKKMKTEQKTPDMSQLALLNMMGMPFLPPPFLPMGNTADFFGQLMRGGAVPPGTPAKRARTRITDEQLKILRQYFDINNSPSEQQIREMSNKAQLPEKVIKHWFRNTLFKERQRDKDSPYNFSIPPQMGIDLDTYEKTGETRVVPLSEMKEEVKEEIQQKPSPSHETFVQPNRFPLEISSLLTVPSTSGRRANRTRFTDYQLRTLQQFFDKQAYPKDDDLEMLSKKLQLSPRVIVVWFQNARQKARKIYENQPSEGVERFVRTPGCNFQCKRCQLVFQRYYELIEHQQKKCYKDDRAALADDNKGVEESLTEDERATLSSSPSEGPTLSKLFVNSSTDVLLKMCEEQSKSFHKKCPSCAIPFKDKQALVQHLEVHEQSASIDVDRLPDAEQGESGSRRDVPLDLSSGQERGESLSISPFLAEDDEESASSPRGTPSHSRSPTGNKRYRTHLTPLQVHVMKCVFAEYKTPSMGECDVLGKEIGLHKRVVQVWFQNARAKERKTRTNGDGDTRLATGCSLCGVTYSPRLTLHEHIFSHPHVAKLKAETNDGQKEKRPHAEPKTPQALPLGLLYGLQSMGAGALSMMLDPAVMGTPIPLLQIPDHVMRQISDDLVAGKTNTTFTQDGKTLSELQNELDPSDAAILAEKHVVVGWACPGCANVFQRESLLKNHQRTVCTHCTTTFTLTQIHYQCTQCNSNHGCQKEFKAHVLTSEHRLNG